MQDYEQAKLRMQELIDEKRRVSEAILKQSAVLLDAWKGYHGLGIGSDVMLKHWSPNYLTPAKPRRARITRLGANSYSSSIMMTVAPFTEAGKVGKRRVGVSEHEWEKIDAAS